VIKKRNTPIHLKIFSRQEKIDEENNLREVPYPLEYDF